VTEQRRTASTANSTKDNCIDYWMVHKKVEHPLDALWIY